MTPTPEQLQEEVKKWNGIAWDRYNEIHSLQQQLTDARKEIEELKSRVSVPRIPPITGSGIKYESGRSEMVSTYCDKCRQIICKCYNTPTA